VHKIDPRVSAAFSSAIRQLKYLPNRWKDFNKQRSSNPKADPAHHTPAAEG